MRYYVKLAARETPVDVTSLPGGGLRVLLEGRPVEVDAVMAGGALSLRIGGRVVDLLLDGAPPTITFAALGNSGRATIDTDKTRADPSRRKSGAAREIREAMVAPMPGRIVRVFVSPGDRLSAGAAVVVIEAMKMENELRALHGAKVAEVLVGPGDAVEAGAKLVLFE